jgi:hypothetical protein
MEEMILVCYNGERYDLSNYDSPCVIGMEGDLVPKAYEPCRDRISRAHCSIEQNSMGLKIQDLDSTNGTTVNDVKISERLLREGDEIILGGGVSFRVERMGLVDKLRRYFGGRNGK